MKREKVLSVAITSEEHEEIMKKLSEVIVNEGKAYSMSDFLRQHFILPILNGQAPKETPSVTIPSEKDDGPKVDSEWNNL